MYVQPKYKNKTLRVCNPCKVVELQGSGKEAAAVLEEMKM